jgi:hypothetical protein
MKKHIFVILLIFCSMQLWSQKTVHVSKVSANSFTQKLQDGSKQVDFTITGFSSEKQASEVVQFIRNFRGVEECTFGFEPSTGICFCVGKFYKYANNKYFSLLLEKAGIEFIELGNNTMPVSEFKNVEL